jgi:hypothetical protein
MPQLNFYVPEEVAEKVKIVAAREGKPISKYLADLVKRELSPGWPEGYFEHVLGSWQGPLDRPEELTPEDRGW